MKTPQGYVGHVRDIVKGQCVRDPEIRFTGPHGSTRVFLRTDGLFAVCIDQGEDYRGAERYVTRAVMLSAAEAKIEARALAGAHDFNPGDLASIGKAVVKRIFEARR